VNVSRQTINSSLGHSRRIFLRRLRQAVTNTDASAVDVADYWSDSYNVAVITKGKKKVALAGGKRGGTQHLLKMMITTPLTVLASITYGVDVPVIDHSAV
jgi:hypothetical protein